MTNAAMISQLHNSIEKDFDDNLVYIYETIFFISSEHSYYGSRFSRSKVYEQPYLNLCCRTERKTFVEHCSGRKLNEQRCQQNASTVSDLFSIYVVNHYTFDILNIRFRVMTLFVKSPETKVFNRLVLLSMFYIFNVKCCKPLITSQINLRISSDKSSGSIVVPTKASFKHQPPVTW